MEIIGKAFNPTDGNARAACVKTDYWMVALITKGDDAQQTIADFTASASTIQADKWDQPKQLWATVQTKSPVIMFCRSLDNNEDAMWREFFHNNIEGIDAKQPISASMGGLVTNLKLLPPGLYYPEDFLKTYNLLSNKSVVLLSTANYERKKDWDKLNDATIQAQKALCLDNPQEGWEAAGQALRDIINPDAAYVIITDADQCRERVHWNVKEGEPTDIKLWVSWSKKGWTFSNDYNENVCEVIQARTGNLVYEGFIGLHITEITDNEITFRYGEEKRILKRGSDITFSYSDSREDHEGTEQYDIRYTLFFKWNQDCDYTQLIQMNTHSIGIDIGGTNTDIGLVRGDGIVKDRTSIPTNRYTQLEPYVHDIMQCIRELMEDNRVNAIDGIGIGAPNGNFYTGCVDNAPNLTIKGVLNFEEEIHKYMDVPVVLSNDANAAAYGEMVYGGAKDLDNFIMFTLGTGVGSGIVLDRKLVHGSTGAAGELGHCILIPGGRQCSCGRQGCLETYTSARGIVQTYCELKGIPVSDKVSSKLIGDLANQGDPIALKTWEVVADQLGLAMANSVTFSAPQAIFLMGGPTKVGDPLLKPLQKAFDKYLLNIYAGSCQIRLSQLPSNDVAILGAAALTKMKQQ